MNFKGKYMPYIKYSKREDLEVDLNSVSKKVETIGELTYCFYKLAINYLGNKESFPTYSDYAEIIAALENSKIEFYLRKLSPYEDIKMQENGDVI